jgi:hypothetical protein
VYNLESGTDRDSATINYSTTDYTLAAGRRVTDVDLWGNYLVVTEVRSSAPTGVYLEIFRAAKLKNRSGVPLNLNAAPAGDLVGTVTVFNAAVSASMVANTSLSAGRAAIGIEPVNDGTAPATGTGPYLFFADLNGVFDDVAATGAGAIHGPVGLDPVTDVAMQGSWAYVTTVGGLKIYDITAVMDANPATMLGNPAPASQIMGNTFDGAFVMGSMLLVTPADRVGVQPYGEGIYSIDVSNPSAPEIQGYFPVGGDTTSCVPLSDSARRMRAKITVAGSRAYYTSGGTLRTIDLE